MALTDTPDLENYTRLPQFTATRFFIQAPLTENLGSSFVLAHIQISPNTQQLRPILPIWHIMAEKTISSPHWGVPMSEQASKEEMSVNLMDLPLEIRDNIWSYVLADVPEQVEVPDNIFWGEKTADWIIRDPFSAGPEKIHQTLFAKQLPMEIYLSKRTLYEASLVFLRRTTLLIYGYCLNTRAWHLHEYLKTFSGNQGYMNVHSLILLESLGVDVFPRRSENYCLFCVPLLRLCTGLRNLVHVNLRFTVPIDTEDFVNAVCADVMERQSEVMEYLPWDRPLSIKLQLRCGIDECRDPDRHYDQFGQVLPKLARMIEEKIRVINRKNRLTWRCVSD